MLLPEVTGTIFLFLSSISRCLRSVLSALSTRWLKSSKRRLSSALNTEGKHREMEEKKRKITPVASGSNTHPRL